VTGVGGPVLKPCLPRLHSSAGLLADSWHLHLMALPGSELRTHIASTGSRCSCQRVGWSCCGAHPREP
jgi:hypothetical protein